MTAESLRFGLVGTGYWARLVHGAALSAHPEVELAGVWGRRPEAAEALARDLGTSAYANVDELFSAVDAVAFAVPPHVQAPLATAAARRGRHLLLEKPIALDVVAAQELATAAEAAEVCTMVFTTLRYLPEMEEWVAHSANRGGWQGFSGRWIGAIDYPGSPYLGSTWRHEWGGLWDLGPHALSVVLPILGEPERVVATRGAGDLVQLDLVHPGGALSALTLTVLADPAAEHTAGELWGPDGVSPMPFPAGDLPAYDAYLVAIFDLVEAVRTGRQRHRNDVRTGLRTVEILAEAQSQLDRG